MTSQPHFYALVQYEDDYVQPLIIAALKTRLPGSAYTLISSLSDYPSSGGSLLQIRAYESLVFEFALEEEQSLINAYIIRKALIRKHFLSTSIANWIVKHPDSVLRMHFKPAVEFELDYAEFLDDALIEAFELRESFEKNQSLPPSEQEWWILKPSMSDRGQGIRLFRSEEQLQGIFEEWEPDEDDEDETNSHDGDDGREKDSNAGVMTSQLRHFIAQPYIHPPLLFVEHGNRKFHIRTYVVAVGALRVFVYKPMLALFAADSYKPPWTVEEDENGPDLRAHLTNTCLQGTGEREGSVMEFWDLPDSLPDGHEASWKDQVFDQICKTTGETFEAAARGMMVHFQPLPSAFEVFGLDFLIDESGTAWLLEVNAFPDFRQTGDDLSNVIGGLWKGVVDVAIKPFFGLDVSECSPLDKSMYKVLDIDLGRR